MYVKAPKNYGFLFAVLPFPPPLFDFGAGELSSPCVVDHLC